MLSYLGEWSDHTFSYTIKVSAVVGRAGLDGGSVSVGLDNYRYICLIRVMDYS